MQAIEAMGAARWASISDWFRRAVVIAAIGLALVSLLLATAATAGRGGSQLGSVRQPVLPTQSQPAADAQPICGLLP